MDRDRTDFCSGRIGCYRRLGSTQNQENGDEDEETFHSKRLSERPEECYLVTGPILSPGTGEGGLEKTLLHTLKPSIRSEMPWRNALFLFRVAFRPSTGRCPAQGNRLFPVVS